jgi:hypothetical protein
MGTHKRKEVPDEQWANRMCLKCHTDFLSTWIGNRICVKCKTHEDYKYDNETYKLDTGRN